MIIIIINNSYLIIIVDALAILGALLILKSLFKMPTSKLHRINKKLISFIRFFAFFWLLVKRGMKI